MIRIATFLEKSCSRQWKCFTAPLLRIGCAQRAFEQGPCKKGKSLQHLQHWFARDVLQFLEEGDAVERLYARDTLLSWTVGGLGRFQYKIMEALLHIVLKVASDKIPMETRAKALQALLQFLPKDAAQRYPNLLCDLCSYRKYVKGYAPSTLLLHLNSLIKTLAPHEIRDCSIGVAW